MPHNPRELFTLTVDSAKMLSPSVRHVVFVKDGDLLPYIPGQFIRIHFEKDGETLMRSYSIASRNNKENKLEIAAGYFKGGPGTELLFNLQPGDSIQASGPFGRLILKDEPVERLILVATGTGVTPYRAMLNDLANKFKDNNLEVALLLGVQKEIDLLYGDEFLEFEKKHPQFTFIPCLSREQVGHYHHGYVQNCFKNINLSPEKDIIYLCGNPNMIDQAFADLKERGFEIKNIRREKYVS